MNGSRSKDMLYIQESELKYIVTLPGHRKKLIMAIQELRGEVCISLYRPAAISRDRWHFSTALS